LSCIATLETVFWEDNQKWETQSVVDFVLYFYELCIRKLKHLP